MEFLTDPEAKTVDINESDYKTIEPNTTRIKSWAVEKIEGFRRNATNPINVGK
jgi:hypothetical protein